MYVRTIAIFAMISLLGIACGSEPPEPLDECFGAECEAPQPNSGFGVDDCEVDSDCEDADACTTGVCVSSPLGNFCRLEPADDGQPCDDGDACTTMDTCHAGSCVGQGTIKCNPSNACQTGGVCDRDTGECTYVPVNDGQNCNDGDPCTVSDRCLQGECTGKPKVCASDSSCKQDGVCDPKTGDCTFEISPNGAPCDDDDACTPSSTCADGNCIGHDRETCAQDDNACTMHVCDPDSGLCEPEPTAVGTACGDTCENGRCQGTDCVKYTKDCTRPPKGKCANGVLTLWEGAGACSLDGGNCVFTPVVTHCPTGQCNPFHQGCAGDCTGQPDRTPCDDLNPCTILDQCNGGTCGGGQLNCSQLDTACALGVCNPNTGSCEQLPKADGAICDDGDYCTTRDSCTAGVCEGTEPRDIEPNDSLATATELLKVDACFEDLHQPFAATFSDPDDVDWYSYYVGAGANTCTSPVMPRVELKNRGGVSNRVCAYFECENGRALSGTDFECAENSHRAEDAPIGMQGCCAIATGEAGVGTAHLIHLDCGQPNNRRVTGTVYVQVDQRASSVGSCGYNLRWGELRPPTGQIGE